MRPMTREWVAKAESDYDGACEALRSRKKSRRDNLLFLPDGAGESLAGAAPSRSRVTGSPSS
jgi:hypothetical protein